MSEKLFADLLKYLQSMDLSHILINGAHSTTEQQHERNPKQKLSLRDSTNLSGGIAKNLWSDETFIYLLLSASLKSR